MSILLICFETFYTYTLKKELKTRTVMAHYDGI